MALANLRVYINPPNVDFIEGNTQRIYAEDMLEVKEAIVDGTKDIKPAVVLVQVAVQLQTTEELPAADSSLRGQIRVKQGGTGVADQLVWCAKKSDDTYVWYPITEAP